VRESGRLPPQETPDDLLVLFLACFLTAPFASKRFFHPLLLARFQVKGATLHFLDNVFLLYLPLEAAKRIFEGLALFEFELPPKELHLPARP
jgi:hypothetical protein